MSTEPGTSLADKGIAEARNGNRLLARLYLERAVETPPVPPLLWLWLAWVAESPEKARSCLERLEGETGLSQIARGALPWIRLMCADAAPEGLATGDGLAVINSQAAPPGDADTEKPARQPPAEYRVECPSCEAVLYVRSSALGAVRTCPSCEEEFELPDDLPRVTSPPPLAGHDYVPGTAYAVDHRGRPGNDGQEGGTAARERSSSHGRAALHPPNPDYPILVVDDNPAIRDVATRVLQRQGYAVEAVENGIEALGWLAKKQPGLVLLDSQMPGMDGFEVCQRLRSHPRTRDLPIIMLSSKDAFFDRVQGRLAGCSVYVTKPCDANVLCEAVERHYCAPTPRPPLRRFEEDRESVLD